MWTNDMVAHLDTMWNREGKTASECARVLGVSRNAVIGKVHRLKFKKRMTKKQKSAGWSDAARAAAAERRASITRAKRLADALPKPRRVLRIGKPAPVATTNDKALIADWLARHGGPRRFEPAATGDPGMIALWLRGQGFQTSFKQGGNGGVIKVVYPDGRKAALTMKQLTALADSIRVEVGLTPIVARAA